MGSLDRTTLVAFLGAVVMGGSNFIAVRFSNQELPPLYGAGIRFAAAGLLFFLIMLIARIPLPRGRAAVGAALNGLLGFGVTYAFIYYALIGLSAGMSSAIVASVPLTTLVLAVLHGQEKFSARGIVGGLLAIAGIAVLSSRVFGGDIRPAYFAAALIGTLAIAESSIVAKAFPNTHPVTTNALGMAVGAAGLIAASLIAGERWVVPTETSTWMALGWLVIFGSVALFGLYLFVINRWTASATNYAVTLMPIVAVTLGVLIADETLTWQTVVGAALVISAVYIGALSQEKPAVPAAEPAKLT